MSSLNDACDVIDFFAAAVSAAFGVVEHGVFVEDLVDRCAPTHGIDPTEHVVEIAKQQGRHGLRHDFSQFDVERAVRSLDSGRLLCRKPPEATCLRRDPSSAHEGCSACDECEGLSVRYGRFFGF
jgi:hypothetical protein